jgi:hypothetical protein
MCPDPVLSYLARVPDRASTTFEVMHHKTSFDVRSGLSDFGSGLIDLHGDIRVPLTVKVSNDSVQGPIGMQSDILDFRGSRLGWGRSECSCRQEHSEDGQPHRASP